MVPYLLLCQATELGLKAFLLSRGMTKHDLRSKFGHNLTKLLGEAKSRGLDKYPQVQRRQEDRHHSRDRVLRRRTEGEGWEALAVL